MKCNYFQDEKLKYEEIEIPDELLFMVRQTVAADRRKKAAGRRMRVLKAVGSVAAVLFLCLTIGVNSSYAFAEAAVKIPIVKSVAKAVVIRSYRPEILAVYEENKVSNHPEKTPVQQEDQPVISGETVSGNDAPVEEEEMMPAQTEPTGQESEPEQALTGIDAWKAEMTVEKLKEVTVIYTPEMEKKYADTPEKLRTILLAQLPGKDIALYGYHEGGSLTGVILRVGEDCQYFEWNYMNDSGKLPELTCADIDGDGTEEITVFLYHGEETDGEAAKESITAPEETGNAGEKADTESSKSETGDADKTETAAGKSGTGNADTTKTPAGKNGTENADTTKTPAGKNGTADKAETGDRAVATDKTSTADRGSADSETGTTMPDAAENAEKSQADRMTETISEQNTAGQEEGEINSVSGNDLEQPTEKPEKKLQPGEVWVVYLKGEKWTAKVFTAEEYENQIRSTLKE